jgi:hypothetical protein
MQHRQKQVPLMRRKDDVEQVMTGLHEGRPAAAVVGFIDSSVSGCNNRFALGLGGSITFFRGYATRGCTFLCPTSKSLGGRDLPLLFFLSITNQRAAALAIFFYLVKTNRRHVHRRHRG